MDESDLNAYADQTHLSMPICKETSERMRKNSQQVWCEPRNVTEYKRARGNIMFSRVSQKNQKSEFCFATNPTGFHRLDEPPEKISAL